MSEVENSLINYKVKIRNLLNELKKKCYNNKEIKSLFNTEIIDNVETDIEDIIKTFKMFYY